MSNHSIYILLFFFGLTACQPKGTFLYQYPKSHSMPIDQVVLVIDFLNLKDDLGKQWDFDSIQHQRTMNRLLAETNHYLVQLGYPKINSYLLSSGLLFKNDFPVDHYLDGELQPNPLYPPFILAKNQIPDQHITQHQEILAILVKYIATRRHLENDDLAHRGMQMGYHFEAIKLPPNTGVLYLQIDQSAPGIVKQLSTVLVSGALASQADYGQVYLDLSSSSQANAFFIHKGSGQILWKNHNINWSPAQPIEELLIQFPLAQGLVQ